MIVQCIVINIGLNDEMIVCVSLQSFPQKAILTYFETLSIQNIDHS